MLFEKDSLFASYKLIPYNLIKQGYSGHDAIHTHDI